MPTTRSAHCVFASTDLKHLANSDAGATRQCRSNHAFSSAIVKPIAFDMPPGIGGRSHPVRKMPPSLGICTAWLYQVPMSVAALADACGLGKDAACLDSALAAELAAPASEPLLESDFEAALALATACNATGTSKKRGESDNVIAPKNSFEFAEVAVRQIGAGVHRTIVDAADFERQRVRLRRD